MASITCDCSTILVNISNDKCANLGLSPIIAWMAIQKMEGSDFNGAMITGTTGGDINLTADWEAKMAAAGDDKITVIGTVEGAATADATDQIDESDPFGGTTLIERNRSITGRLHFPSAQTITGVNTVNKCIDKLRIWVLDSNYNLQVFENANLRFSELKRPGRGQTLPAHFEFTMSSNEIEEPAFEVPTTDFRFLTTLANV